MNRVTAERSSVSCDDCGDDLRGFFRSLVGGRLERIERGKTVLRFRRGDIVFREGEPVSSVYCIHSGTVKLYKLGREGEEIVIRLLGPGDIMGYRPLLANDTAAATARVLDDATVCAITRKHMLAALRESPELSIRLMEKLARELRESEDQMVRRVVENVPQRTARFLLWLYEASSSVTGHARFESVLRREDMAMAIGTTPETLSRILHDLQRREILGLSRRTIHIREPEKLRLLARHGTLE